MALLAEARRIHRESCTPDEMKYQPNVWQQLKSITADELIRALENDGWVQEIRIGAQLAYRHDNGRIVTIHYHPHKTYGPKTLKGLLDAIGWSVDDLKRLKLVKRKS